MTSCKTKYLLQDMFIYAPPPQKKNEKFWKKVFEHMFIKISSPSKEYGVLQPVKSHYQLIKLRILCLGISSNHKRTIECTKILENI